MSSGCCLDDPPLIDESRVHAKKRVLSYSKYCLPARTSRTEKWLLNKCYNREKSLYYNVVCRVRAFRTPRFKM